VLLGIADVPWRNAYVNGANLCEHLLLLLLIMPNRCYVDDWLVLLRLLILHGWC